MRRSQVTGLFAMVLTAFLLGYSPWAHADTAREWFGRAYDSLNQKTQRGRYFVTGELVQTGTFVATLKMPQQMQWVMTEAATKRQQTYKWTTDKGFEGLQEPKGKVDSLASSWGQPVAKQRC